MAADREKRRVVCGVVRIRAVCYSYVRHTSCHRPHRNDGNDGLIHVGERFLYSCNGTVKSQRHEVDLSSAGTSFDSHRLGIIAR